MAKAAIKLMGITQNFDQLGNPTQFRASYQVLDERGAVVASNALYVIPITDALDLTEELELTSEQVEGFKESGGYNIGETSVKKYNSVLLTYLKEKIKEKEGVMEFVSSPITATDSDARL
ncbi:hypothetical protein VE23_09770 [Paenibacillus sp. D9]|uniref:hypothetical protein n=1 Tax=Paenibacillus sp. D9 TaxID=665792 RepID=UPI00061F2403|nr:hypothetical protein [Paenibacillus sp. D9]KKC47374.1 hypothetical protein VE23_09770 [Paenibacillus sp. D9]